MQGVEDRGIDASPSCDEFLAHHSEFVDGRMSAVDERRWRRHAGACASCAHYDEVVRRGGELLAGLESPALSDDFAFRLRHRLLHVKEEERERLLGSGASLAAALLVAGALAAVAWSPVVRELGGRLGARPAVATDAPADSGAVAARLSSPASPDPDWSVDVHRVVPPLLPTSLAEAPTVLWSARSGRDSGPLFVGPQSGYLDRPGMFSPLVISPPAYHLTSSVQSASAR